MSGPVVQFSVFHVPNSPLSLVVSSARPWSTAPGHGGETGGGIVQKLVPQWTSNELGEGILSAAGSDRLRI